MLHPDEALTVLAQTSVEESAADAFLEDNGPILGFVLLIALMVFGLIGVRSALKGRERSDELAAIARGEGWRFLPDRVNGAKVDLPFASFIKGDGRGTSNLLRATIDGHAVSAFDYWWYVERERRGYVDEGVALNDILSTTSGTDVTSRSYSSITCAMAEIPNVLPHLVVTHETLAIKAVSAIGGSIDLESEEFNRRFHVRSDDRRFATAFLDAQMQDFMLSCEGKLTFEARGRWLLISGPVLDAQRTAELLRQVARYRSLVPRMIDDMFPPLIPEGGP